jgi:hypothetical protein
VRSYYSAQNVTDVALYTEPEEIYLMKKNGNVVLYDATAKRETVKISNSQVLGSALLQDNSDYQVIFNLFDRLPFRSAVREREGADLCDAVGSRGAQRAAHQCLYILGIHTYHAYLAYIAHHSQGSWLYRINLDLYKYGLSR